MKLLSLKMAAMALLATVSTFSWADESKMSGDDIMKQAVAANYYGGKDAMGEGKMTITDKNGSVRIRQFKVLRLNQESKGDTEADQHYFVRFSEPSDLDGVVFMVKKHVGSDDDRWLYLPKLDLVRRIAAGDKRTSFVGSDVLYEDVSGRHLLEDTHKLDSESKSYYVVQSTPKNASEVEFKSYKTWIHKKTFLALKREYYDGNGNKYRQIKAQKVTTIDGVPTVVESIVQDYNTGSVTTVNYSDVKYNIGVDNDLFQERYLRNPPSQWF